MFLARPRGYTWLDDAPGVERSTTWRSLPLGLFERWTKFLLVAAPGFLLKRWKKLHRIVSVIFIYTALQNLAVGIQCRRPDHRQLRAQ